VPQLGFTLHGIEQYEVADWDRVAAGFALGQHAGVMAVVPFSPADKAGLTADDQLVSVNGRTLDRAATDPSDRPTRAFVERSQRIILQEMERGEVTLRVSDARGLRDVRLVPELGCTSNVELVPGPDVNAWADGERVVISAGIVAQCVTDDELALVIAHELAHNLLRHAERLARAHAETSADPAGARSAAMPDTEEEADRLGVRLAAAAGYDLHGAGPFLSGLIGSIGPDQRANTHPGTALRLASLSVYVGEESAMRRPGLARAGSYR